jgi:hypothetical protein
MCTNALVCLVFVWACLCYALKLAPCYEAIDRYLQETVDKLYLHVRCEFVMFVRCQKLKIKSIFLLECPLYFDLRRRLISVAEKSLLLNFFLIEGIFKAIMSARYELVCKALGEFVWAAFLRRLRQLNLLLNLKNRKKWCIIIYLSISFVTIFAKSSLFIYSSILFLTQYNPIVSAYKSKCPRHQV